jgi:hypothetical protein
MPRRRKTMTGQTAMPVKPVTGAGYGQGVAQSRLQQQMPAPRATVPTIQARSGPSAQPRVATPPVAPAGATPQTASAPARPDLMQIAQQLRGQAGILSAPTARPSEPVTAGLPLGPGPGPQALAQPYGNPIGDVLRRVARATGDTHLEQLIMRSRL